MATEQRVLRVRRSDDENNGFVLIRVTGKKSASHPLDLDLVGTEGVAPYVCTVKHSQIRKLRASNYQGTDADWETLLAHTFLPQAEPAAEHVQQEQQQDANDHREAVTHGVETVASIADDDDGKLTLTIRKNISGITQRLGSIQLARDDEQEIELFDWAGGAALAASDAQDRVVALNERLREQQDAIARLNAQLDELVKAKTAHEDELLGKFAQLLNAKKLKIRNQQRLLSGATATTSSAQDGARGGVSATGKGKRKARRDAAADEEPESDDGFEPRPADTMDVDVDVKDEDQDDDELEQHAAQETPDQTDSEDGDDLDAPTAVGKGRTPKSSSPAPEASSTLRADHGKPEQTPSSVPAKRDLPFARRNLRGKTPVDEDDDADETEDDEL